ncbi:hypothetical protein QH494_03665 [Sphingomonas sp. AR_OL41]|uniref:hypothetical protein n=1 Tax=Sphingomonas sp. AR_OL41 TaxID=3042729 RepID=UPI0024802240|nr:hypothetical protein [Sphingomonas sp. AR_OL41]MDH7971267.1 hypothetical protein [Sphingomonas sp. AR_OL41]
MANPDPSTAGDRVRFRSARRRAHRRVEGITDARRLVLRWAFREEMGVNVRSASPFLVGLLRGEHLTLDEAVHLINPLPGWPRRPRLSSAGSGALGPNLHMFRHYFAGLAAGVGHPPLRDEFHGHTFILAEGGHARMQVVGHSIEVEAKIGSVRFETRFGVLRIELDRSLPETLALASLGRDVEQIVDHPALLGRGWRIVEVVAARSPFLGSVLVVPTGAIPYSLPWAA